MRKMVSFLLYVRFSSTQTGNDCVGVYRIFRDDSFWCVLFFHSSGSHLY